MQSSFLASQDFIIAKRLGAYHTNYDFQFLTFELLPDNYSVCKLSPHADISGLVLNKVFCLARDEQEISLVCVTGYEPSEAQIEKSWCAVRIQQKLDFSMIGVIARIATLFAAQGISIYVNSTYSTDYFFIKQDQLHLAIETLKDAQYKVLP